MRSRNESSTDDCGCPFYQGKPWHWDTCEPSGAAEANRRDWAAFNNYVLFRFPEFKSFEEYREHWFYKDAREALENGGCRQ